MTRVPAKIGQEILLEERMNLLQGMKVGLITNQTGVDRRLAHIKDFLARREEVELTAIFAPEHGLYGCQQAGKHVEDAIDQRSGIPVYSLYRREEIQRGDGPDYVVDSILARHAREPMTDRLGEIEALVFDIQDVGTRVYTYIWTMALAMRKAAEKGVMFVVLDRPNPINGLRMEGRTLDPNFRSFIGLYPIPLRHGMTVAELASLFNLRHGIGADLKVVEMRGWRRDMWFDDTGLIWVPPSPNVPTLATALVYVGMVMLEGTNVSEGRGTTAPFEVIGAPWLDAEALLARLKGLSLPGAIFRAIKFIPTFSKHQGQTCRGIQVHVIDRDEYRPYMTSLSVISEIMRMHPDAFGWTEYPVGSGHYFDRVVGTDIVRKALEDGVSAEGICEDNAEDLSDFSGVREEYLIY